MSIITRINTKVISNITAIDTSFHVINLFDVSNNNLVYKNIKKKRFLELFYNNLENGNINTKIDSSGEELKLSSKNWSYSIDHSLNLFNLVEGIISKEKNISITNEKIKIDTRIELQKNIFKIFNLHKNSNNKIFSNDFTLHNLINILNINNIEKNRTIQSPINKGDKIVYSIIFKSIEVNVSDIEFRLHFIII